MSVVCDKPIYVFADERRLWQILSNLVGNAIKFTEVGAIDVHVEGDAREVTITVRDTGPGIPEADIESIFDEYRQLGSSSMRQKGSGLGLFIARRLVAMHGGAISVRSEIGKGSEFLVRIPVWSPMLEQAPQSSLLSGFSQTAARRLRA